MTSYSSPLRPFGVLIGAAFVAGLVACGGGDTTPTEPTPEPDAVALPEPAPPAGGEFAAPLEGGPEEAVDYDGNLVDPRFPNTQDEGPEIWPPWRPTHTLDLLELPMNDGRTMTFERGHDTLAVRGEIYLEGDRFELRHKLYENGERVTFERIQCNWKERGSKIELACKAPQNKTVKTLFRIVRAAGGFTLSLDDPEDPDLKLAPREIKATLL